VNVKDIIAAIQNLNETDAIAVNNAVADHINYLRKVRRNKIKGEIGVGSRVKVNHPKLAGKEFEVVNIKRTKAEIKQIGGSKTAYFQVSITLLEPIA
jgi:hypothetical protein